MMIGGIGAATVDEEGERCWVIATLESSRVELSSLCLTLPSIVASARLADAALASRGHIARQA
jgi:hypothetical protein